MALVAGIDCSTQKSKVVIRDAGSGELVRQGSAPHPEGTAVDPRDWHAAMERAIAEAGGLDDVEAVAVGGQQHGMVTLDADGEVVRPALMWNDTRSADAAHELIDELGGRDRWAEAVNVVPVASFTVSKVRWLCDAEPENADRTAAVCLPHDYLTWRLAGGDDLEALRTDRGDASGTGYWSAADGYRWDILEHAMRGRRPRLPEVLGPHDEAGRLPSGAVLGPGTGDNAAASLGLGAEPGDVVVSIGTSGVACATAEAPVSDPSGTVAGFADATGRFLPLIATLNAARTLDAAAKLLDVDHARLSELALSAPAGADGLVLVPYLEGERTPDKPHSSGALHGLRIANATPAHLARAAVEGLLCGLADAVDALAGLGVEVNRVLLIGGGSQSEAVRRIAPSVLGHPVLVPPPGRVRRRRRRPAGGLDPVGGRHAAGLGAARRRALRGRAGRGRAGALRRGARADGGPPGVSPVELRAGTAALTVDPAVGARWTSWRVGDLELLSGAEPPLPPWFHRGCFVMAPFAGRIRDGRVRVGGAEVELPRDDPPNAIHGTVAGVPWTVDAAEPAAVSLSVALGPPWPAAGSVTQRLALSGDRLEGELVLRAEDAMPAWIGWHPWFARRLARGGAAAWRVDGGRRFVKGADGLPTGELTDPGAGPWDDAFRDFASAPGIEWPGALRLAVESSGGHFVLFDELPHVLCLEPQTAPPDAARLGAAAQLEPGGELVLRCVWRWSAA